MDHLISMVLHVWSMISPSINVHSFSIEIGHCRYAIAERYMPLNGLIYALKKKFLT